MHTSLPTRPLRASVTIHLFNDPAGRPAYRVEIYSPLMSETKAIRRALLALWEYLARVGKASLRS